MDTSIVEFLQDGAARGAAWLDTQDPSWFERIDFSTLDLNDPRNCICAQGLGQGGFSRAIRDGCTLTLDEFHGFAGNYPELHDAWCQQVSLRYVTRAGEIGPIKREIEFEPMPESDPVPEPTPAPAPAPAREPVPA